MSDFYLSVTQACVEKKYSYQAAFANVPCECCDTIMPVFSVTARYSSVTLLEAFVLENGIEGAVGQAMQLYALLRTRIDAADQAFAEEEQRAAAATADMSDRWRTTN